MTVLLIDTFKSDLLEGERLLKNAGLVGVRAVGTHFEAERLLGLTGDARAPFSVDTIVIDITTGAEGINLFHALRDHAYYRHVPIILVAHADGEERMRTAFAVGAEDFVPKPYTATELVARVRRALRTHEDTTLRLRREQELFALGEEMTQLKGLLTRVMLIDPQTALASRRCFEESLAAEWRRTQRSGKPLAIIACGIDAFGRYNDQLGHQAGDATLKRVARAMRSRLGRPGDVLARFGGGVFVALLPEIGADEALIVAENLRHAVHQEAILFRGAPTGEERITMSCGAAAATGGEIREAPILLERAEAALQDAKTAGGNRVRGTALPAPLAFKESA